MAPGLTGHERATIRKQTKEERKAQLQANMRKAQAANLLKKQRRDAIRKKVELGMPITVEERDALVFRLNVKQTSKKAQENATLAAASKLLIQPANVKELRALVDRIAHKHEYNPLESLIVLAKAGQLSIEDQIAVHKTLLPYLTPQLKVAPQKEEVPESKAVSVTIKSFQFAPATPTQKIHEQARNSSVTTPVPEPTSPA